MRGLFWWCCSISCIEYLPIQANNQQMTTLSASVSSGAYQWISLATQSHTNTIIAFIMRLQKTSQRNRKPFVAPRMAADKKDHELPGCREFECTILCGLYRRLMKILLQQVNEMPLCIASVQLPDTNTKPRPQVERRYCVLTNLDRHSASQTFYISRPWLEAPSICRIISAEPTNGSNNDIVSRKSRMNGGSRFTRISTCTSDSMDAITFVFYGFSTLKACWMLRL